MTPLTGYRMVSKRSQFTYVSMEVVGNIFNLDSSSQEYVHQKDLDMTISPIIPHIITI